MSRYLRIVAALLAVPALLWLAGYGWHAYRVRSLAAECLTLERAGHWVRLLRSAREWTRLEPESRKARQAGATAGRLLRDVSAVAEFLESFPRDLPEDVPSLSMLADLKFGPLNRPDEGAEVCRDILNIVPNHQESHQRLIYYYAMTQQQIAMQSQITMAITNECELSEAYVYGFLGSGLRLQNGADVTRRWLAGDTTSERLLVALALHISQSLSGAIPSVDEATAQKIRLQQKERESALRELLLQYPENQELLAYLLLDAMETGSAARAGELLGQAPPESDQDFRFWHVRGWVFAHLQEYKEAERSYEKAIQLNPLDWRIRFHLAETLRGTGRLDEADRMNQIAISGRAIEKELLQQPDMRSIPADIYRRLSEYCRQCNSLRMANRITSFLNRSDAETQSGMEAQSGFSQPKP